MFRPLSRKELDDWRGPINYISMVEAFKQGPGASTPLRICMNSSMKQPGGHSLNDLLMKGPPSILDLFSVTLGMREYPYVLAKDLSKFYNRVEADELTQHVRRVIWRNGNEEESPTVYVTTTVNFGDKPAGCIAIVAVKKTVEMFGKDRPEAA